MEFRDLKKQYSVLKEKIDKSVIEVMTSGNFIMGQPVLDLEKSLAEYVGVKHCITCGNVTDALTMVLMGWNIGQGDAVFIPDFTFFASGEVVSFEGATPIFVDVDENTFNINVDKLEVAIKNTLKEGKLKPKVIVAVDLFGLPANFEEIKFIAKKYNLLLLEDGAQGFGGRIGEQRACSFGDASTTSFFPAKPLGCYGDGGAIFTDNDELAEYIRSIRVHGKGSFKYDNVRIGMNSRLDTLQAAILKEKFEAFKNYELDSVNKSAKIYTEKLSRYVQTPVVPEGYYSSLAQYTIKLDNESIRNSLQEFLKDNGIPSMVYYPKPMHEQTAFMMLECNENFEVTDKLCKTALSLPMHPYMDEGDIKEVCEKVSSFIEGFNR